MTIEAQIAELGWTDALAARDTALRRLDPRAKLVATLAFILFVLSFPKYEIAGLLPFAFYPVVLMALGDVPLRFILRRLLIVSPFVLCMAMFNPWFDRAPVALPGAWTVAGGWLSFLSILLRFALTVGSTLALIAGTGIHNVCRGLERLGVPTVFSVQVLFLYRYLFVLAAEGARMVRARALRSFGARGQGLRIYGQMLGSLLLRTLDRAQRIHLAMCCRGFDGHVRTLGALRLRPADVLFVTVSVGAFILLRTVNLPRALGALLTGGLS
jgi:cobalt/nickel transport system permease protein